MPGHESLRAWQSADSVARAIFVELNTQWNRRDAPIHDQLRRAALSVALNIAEGYASGPGDRCRAHLRIAYASAVETTCLLRFLQSLGVDVGDLVRRSEATKGMTYRLWQRSRKTPAK
ncbi:MAG TPA: four helix bundle protein [Gemmatimonadales bacterium]|nr:four helix bundle protein [Gemmatimonadales bacterium]